MQLCCYGDAAEYLTGYSVRGETDGDRLVLLGERGEKGGERCVVGELVTSEYADSLSVSTAGELLVFTKEGCASIAEDFRPLRNVTLDRRELRMLSVRDFDRRQGEPA